MSQILGLGLDNKGNTGHLGKAWGLLSLSLRPQNQRGHSDKARTSRLTNPVGVDTGLAQHGL